MKADMNGIGTSVCDQISQHLLLQGGHNGVGKHKLDHSESAEEKVSLVPVDWGLRCAQKKTKCLFYFMLDKALQPGRLFRRLHTDRSR